MSKLIDRVAWAKQHLENVEPTHCIIWEDPDDPDAPCKVTTPAGEWLAMAFHGGLLPPVEVYDKLRAIKARDGDLRADEVGPLIHQTAPVRAMDMQEAMQYLVNKDIPPHVRAAHNTGNRPYIRIVPRSAIPSDRSFRNAWKMALGDEGEIHA